MSIATAFEHPDRLVTKNDVKTLVGYSDASLWRLEHLPISDPRKFPSRIRLSRNRVCWRQQDILDWIARQQAA
jgi:predicted DNA-binding transcriptional regulator AlpA